MIFLRPINYQHRVRIFARPMTAGYQVIWFDFSYNSDHPNTAIVPLPAAAEPIVSVSSYPLLFQHLNRLFLARSERARETETRAAQVYGELRQPTLQRTGEIVGMESLAIDRPWSIVLDLPAGWWRILPVSVLYLRRRPGVLHFPTIRSDNGRLPPESIWDHSLFLQDCCPLVVEPVWLGAEWSVSMYPVGVSVVENGLMRSEATVCRSRVVGRNENRDVFIVERLGVPESESAERTADDLLSQATGERTDGNDQGN